ncbi:hypothetical protein EA462_13900 [Natrarchaeobius halalkaliphilus]|uniref:Uncharacterized protein n=1 Tax=Natrarchaeobius halalkaliphilus TaxID=1679091 RepID=A0A3N6LJ87_9EURY|nr:hypothetical protein EA462_13900 [Natrarchaeobius halalkaliphilus]
MTRSSTTDSSDREPIQDGSNTAIERTKNGGQRHDRKRSQMKTRHTNRPTNPASTDRSDAPAAASPLIGGDRS